MFGKIAAALRKRFTREERREPLDCQTATAVLLVRATIADGDLAEEESSRLHSLLRQEYELNDEAAQALVERARKIEDEAVDLYAFSSLLKRELDQKGREHVVAMLWKMVYADGRVHEFEDNLVWRVAELLGVSSRERIRMKKAVRAEAGESEESKECEG